MPVRNLTRYREVAAVLAKYGYGYILEQIGLARLLSLPQRVLKKQPGGEGLSRGQRLRLALEELGPTYVKLGQLLSVRRDLLPEDIVLELERLQDAVAPVAFDRVLEVIGEELGRGAFEVFQAIDESPLASASLGQVHRAVLPGGREVVLKVQRPGVAKVIDRDLEVLYTIARLADDHTLWGKIYDFTDMVQEFEHSIRLELDYRAEGRNAYRFRRLFAEDDDIYIPKVYWEFTTRRLLTMELVRGVKINNLAELDAAGHDRSRLGRLLAGFFLEQVLIHGYFHADPHPGNFFVDRNGALVVMDFGIVGNLDEKTIDCFVDFARGVADRDSDRLVRAIVDLGVVPRDTDLRSLTRDVTRLQKYYYELPLSEIKLGQAFGELLDLAFKYRITFPSDFVLLAKSVMTVEGLVEALDPDIGIAEMIEPEIRRLMKKRLSPPYLTRRFSRAANEYARILFDLPRRADRVLELVEENRLTVRMEHTNLPALGAHLTALVNRLVVAIVLAALIIGSALLATATASFFTLPIAEYGFLISGLMGLVLLLYMFRSGRF